MEKSHESRVGPLGVDPGGEHICGAVAMAAPMVWWGNTSLWSGLHPSSPATGATTLQSNHPGHGAAPVCPLHPTGWGIVYLGWMESSRASPRDTVQPVVLSTGNIWGFAHAAPSNISHVPELQQGMAKPREIAQPDCSRDLVFA